MIQITINNSSIYATKHNNINNNNNNNDTRLK
jgi:hypothetical protein